MWRHGIGIINAQHAIHFFRIRQFRPKMQFKPINSGTETPIGIEFISKKRIN